MLSGVVAYVEDCLVMVYRVRDSARDCVLVLLLLFGMSSGTRSGKESEESGAEVIDLACTDEVSYRWVSS